MMSPHSEQYVSYVLDRARASCRRGGYSDSTTKHYLYWIRRFMEVSEVSGPQDLHSENAQTFLNTLSGYARPTQKQARIALDFLFHTVLMGPLDDGSRLPERMAQASPAGFSQAGAEIGGGPAGSVPMSSSSWNRGRESVAACSGEARFQRKGAPSVRLAPAR